MKELNGFYVIAEGYRRAAAAGEISQEVADRHCRIYDFLAACDEEDFDILFESSAFNEIAEGYLRIAVRELVKEGKITKDQGWEIEVRFGGLFDDVSSKDARKS